MQALTLQGNLFNMKTPSMSTYIIHVPIASAGIDAIGLLINRMQEENFLLVNNQSFVGCTFRYYGNQNLVQINRAVQRASAATGFPFSFTVIKDKQGEQQTHAKGKAALQQD